jgi:hypothetical protein
VAHALERLWIARSRLASDRSFCQSRHSMHFFVSNLLYYLQVRISLCGCCAVAIIGFYGLLLPALCIIYRSLLRFFKTNWRSCYVRL